MRGEELPRAWHAILAISFLAFLVHLCYTVLA